MAKPWGPSCIFDVIGVNERALRTESDRPRSKGRGASSEAFVSRPLDGRYCYSFGFSTLGRKLSFFAVRECETPFSYNLFHRGNRADPKISEIVGVSLESCVQSGSQRPEAVRSDDCADADSSGQGE